MSLKLSQLGFFLLKLIDWANFCNFAIDDFVIGLIILEFATF